VATTPTEPCASETQHDHRFAEYYSAVAPAKNQHKSDDYEGSDNRTRTHQKRDELCLEGRRHQPPARHG
jgi:hypothetical protein